MLTRNYTAADDPSSSSQADSRLSLGSPLSQGGDTDDSPSREYTSSRIIYAHQSMDVDGDDDGDDDDMHPTRPSTTLSDFDQQRFEQDVLDLSIAHHSSYAVGGSDRVLRSMRHAHDTNMGRRRALSSNNEQHTIGSETLLPSSNRRNNLRFAYQRQTSTNGSINHNEDGRDRSTPSNSTNHHHDQEQQRQREGLEALTRIETQFAELRNRIYQERMAELNREALMISQGTHPEMAPFFQVLDQRKADRTREAEALYKQRKNVIRNEYDAIKHQANTEFVAKRKDLKEKLLANLHQQLFQLKYERETLLRRMATPPGNRHSAILSRPSMKRQKQQQQQQHKPRYPKVVPIPQGLPQASACKDLNMIKNK
ncbi:hypothetical protein O0I10_007221 [Lichtheimia ornata]|uniref:Uncharacterized protein n=1 Tax=Lichtheimia ornata TaxID=688661 RepID=A0AAD7XY46_9FUNG|nr:uncharacterized protein O0I10_007221 [Lichtheimia ornata]KAJ8657141.1 hypothetical protein O0I10_007221 [Lichtheimia ornata]